MTTTIRTFPPNVEQLLLENKIVNGLGGQGGFNFDKFFQDNIVYLEEFLPNKGVKLYDDIRRLSYPHDIEFLLGGNSFDFYLSNYRFVIGVYQLLHWTKITNRLAIFLSLLIMLNRYGKQYFNFLNK